MNTPSLASSSFLTLLFFVSVSMSSVLLLRAGHVVLKYRAWGAPFLGALQGLCSVVSMLVVTNTVWQLTLARSLWGWHWRDVTAQVLYTGAFIPFAFALGFVLAVERWARRRLPPRRPTLGWAAYLRSARI